MRETLVFLLCILFLSSCSTLEGEKDFKRVEMNEFYQDSGMNRYFLPALPLWANFSEGGQCQRSRSMVYLDIEALKKGQALSYEQAIQLQYLFNLSRDERIAETKVKALPPSEEEKLFFEALQKIHSGFLPFIRPKFSRLHLVWLDSVLGSEEKVKELKKVMGSSTMSQGQPVFISLCMDKQEMENFLTQNGLFDARTRLIPMELFSVFDTEGKRQKQYLLNLNSLFDTKQELHLFLLGGNRPKEFKGEYEVHP